MSSKSVKLAKVILKQGGLKGLDVVYSKTEIVENVPFPVEQNSKHKRPIHKALADKFNSLREHVQNICRLSQTVPITDIEVISVTSNEDRFILSAKITTFDNKIFAVNTPNMDINSDYERAEEVLKTIDGIYDETVKYLSKKEKLEAQQYLIEFAAKSDEKKLESVGLTKEFDFTQLNETERREKMIEVLQLQGCIVMSPDDIGDEQPAATAAPAATAGEDAAAPAVKEETAKKASDAKPKMQKVA